MSVQYVSFDVTVTCRVDCDLERVDYGVRGSPIGYDADPNTVKVSMIAIDEINVDALPKQLLDYIEEIAAEKALDKGEWQ